MELTAREDRLFKEMEPRLKAIVATFRNGQPNPDITENVHQLYLKIVLEGKRPVHTASDEEFYKYFCVSARNLLASELKRSSREQVSDDPHMEKGSKPKPVLHPRGSLTRVVDDDMLKLLTAAVVDLGDEDWQLYFRIKMLHQEQTKVFRELGLPESTGRDRLDRIHRQLALVLHELDPEEGASPDG
ncbi:MAG: hypothetical protein CMJ39_02670 [Phycisphaerae bacterium]|nr:hypothetical protein [Phycisphaerae bacterium]|tara:strand:+ start:165 stop:725 length:561 start_codon:yes stop_codon:yes gene_type:complete